MTRQKADLKSGVKTNSNATLQEHQNPPDQNGMATKKNKLEKDPVADNSDPERPKENEPLNPKPNVTKYDTDPTFFSNLPIPHISTLAHSRLLIRAVLIDDMKLFKQLLTKDISKIASIIIPRSPNIDRNVLSYILQLGNKDAMKMLYNVDYSAGKFPGLLLEMESTGQGSKMMFGHDLEEVTVGRGNKEGNAAFLFDSNHYQLQQLSNEEDCDLRDFYKEAIMVGTSLSTLQYHVSKIAKYNSGAITHLLSSIVYAVRYGNQDLAGKLVNLAIKRGGHGFNQLHEEALVLDENKPFSAFYSASVVKKSIENSQITPLHCAAINPNPQYLEALLNSNSEYSILDTENWSLVHYAAVCSGDGPLKLLLSKGIPTMVVDKEGNTPLMLAVSRGRLHNVKLLLANEHSDIELNEPAPTSSIGKANNAGMTPMLIACSEGHVEIVKALLDAGCDGNEPSAAKLDQVTPLMVASRCGHLAVVKCLIDQGVKVELGDRKGRTAIAFAVINGHADIVSYLLRLGVNHEAKDSSGNNLVHYAAAYGWYFNMQLLLEAGCNPNQENLWKMTPTAVAFLKGHIGIVEMLLEQPAVDIDTPIDNKSGMSLLLKTCKSSKLSINLVQRLTYLVNEQKADCKKVDFMGNNGLHYLMGHELAEDSKYFKENLQYLLEAAKMLIDRGCDSGALNNRKESPLFLAISRGNFWVAEKLIDWGQELGTEINYQGDTILHQIVKYATSSTMAKWLYEKLAKDFDTLIALKAMVNVYNANGYTALLQVLNSFPTVSLKSSKYLNLLVTFLINDLGANVDAAVKGHNDSAVLHLAVATSYAETIIPVILAKKPDLDPLNKDQQTPLALTILNGLAGSAKTLINANANVNFKLKGTGLLLVLGKKHSNLFSLIPLFISKGSDVSEVTQDLKNSILHFVAKNPAQNHALEAIQSIITAGGDVNLKNTSGRTPLILAVNARGKETDATYDVEDALISAGANLSAKDKRSRTVLHYVFVKIGKPLETSFFDPIELAKMITNAMKAANMADAIKDKDAFGSMAFHYGAMRGSTICCSHLMTEMQGEHIDITDSRGNTPYGLAVWAGHEGCALYFQQQGADFSKILNTNIQIQNDKQTHQTALVWTHEKLQRTEVEKEKLKHKKYPIFQEVVKKDWQGILHLMLADLKSSGNNVSVGVSTAIKTQRLKLAIKLIHGVTHPKELEQQKETLLHTLAKHSKPNSPEDQLNSEIAVLNSLVKKGLSSQHLDEYQATAPIYASIHLNHPIILELSNVMDNPNHLNVVSKTPPDLYGRTPFTALFWKLNETTEFSKDIKSWAISLLSHGASANVLSQYPFILSPYPGTRCLFKNDDKEVRNLRKYSPLITAVIQGNLDVVKWLLTLGSSKVDPNFGDDEGCTPLMHAVRLNDLKMVKLLLDPDSYNYQNDKSTWRINYDSWTRGKGGLELDINARDKKGWTAGDHLICPALQQLDYTYENVEPILTILFKAGASFATKSGDDLSPLERAVLHKRIHILKVMYKLLKTNRNQKVVIKPEYAALSKLDNCEPEFEQIPTFTEDAKKAAEIKEKESLDEGPQGPQPDSLLGMDKNNSEVVMDQAQNIPYDCIMTKVDISYGLYGLYNFYKMQVVRELRGNQLLVFLFTQWGRVGDTGQYQKTPFPTEEEAVKEFKKIFKSKTDNDWEQLNSFVPIPKKYRLVNRELAKDKKAHEMKVDFDHLHDSAKIKRSVLKPLVYEAIKKMCFAHTLENLALSGNTNRTFQNFESLPIVTTEALKKGEEILNKISRVLHKLEWLSSEKDITEALRVVLVEKMIVKSEEFYALIPVYGFVTEKLEPVCDWHSLRRRQDEIWSMIHLGFAKKLLLAAELNSALTNPFEYVYRCLGTKIQLLDLGNEEENEEAQMILQYIHNTKEGNVEIQGIYSIKLREETELLLDNRWLLWHGTKTENLLSILSSGLQAAPLGSKLSGHLFGKGIYLADMFAKGQKYSYKSGGSDSKFMLLCEAALGKIHEVESLANLVAEEGAERYGQFLPPGYDSMKTNDSVYEPDPRVSTIWKGRTVPLGTKVNIHYKEGETWGLNYNEYTVCNENQVKVRYLIQYAETGSDNKLFQA